VNSENYQSSNFNATAIKGNKWYNGMLNYGVSLSEDSGATWRAVNTGIPGQGKHVYSLLATATGNILAGSAGKLYQSVTDTSWAVLYNFPANEEVHHLLEAGQYLFAGTRVFSNHTGGLYRSADSGQTWQLVSDNWNTAYKAVHGLVLQGNRIIAGTMTQGIRYSTDFGTTWQMLDIGIPVTAISDMKLVRDKVYVTIQFEENMYELGPDTLAWNCITCTAGDPRVITVWGTDSILYAGGANGGVCKWVLPPVDTSGSVSAPSLLSSDSGFKLYPNPAASPVLAATARQNFPLNLQIFDSNGRLVRSEIVTHNNHAITSENLSNGLYLLRILDERRSVHSMKWMKTE
ncbi:MAG: T9SS type A sorting domain-containing protein, partial [Sphingobacteriales bacterium]